MVVSLHGFVVTAPNLQWLGALLIARGLPFRIEGRVCDQRIVNVTTTLTTTSGHQKLLIYQLFILCLYL